MSWREELCEQRVMEVVSCEVDEEVPGYGDEGPYTMWKVTANTGPESVLTLVLGCAVPVGTYLFVDVDEVREQTAAAVDPGEGIGF